ncbi:LysR family transcriptional regulator [Burkholderia territorii]|uniref:LysR family transcriptional regulator n=1 Tax=Burkholderia territorii TaxID=1503055 RepID=A0A6L3NMX6_9BURK|nr:LysR family transcriptional regulator [Burkholderia territorii]KAB0685587.1 LysR family transcriptional regulator [Burkholderia territorii]MBM2774545.1 LysR family transcriptional regulator [Burkholderia territorii]VWB81450.1 LysR family transcriptional regulator [Burkholderia territorii]
MDYFAAVRAFVRAAELESFSKTANELAVKTSTVSRYISELEKDMGIALFNRSTRGLVLTEGGRLFRERAVFALQALDEAREATSSLNRSPQGLLRVTIPPAFGRLHVVPHLPAFMARYPDIDLDIVSTDETVNMIDAGVDVAIRTGVMPDSSLMARRLAPHRRIVCGSPAYFGRRGTPSTPDDLPAHDTLRLSLMPDDKWSFTRSRAALRPVQEASEPLMIELKGRLRADDQEAVLALAVAGCGVALLPTWLASADLRAGKLQQVLPEWEARLGRAEPAVWAAYPPKKIVSSKVRAFVDFYAEAFGEPPYWDDGLEPERAP